MKLDHVSIKNFRSIKELNLNFEPSCKILVGINESGKSNILKALNLLDTDVTSTRKDLREPIKGENQPTEAYVRFIFKFNEGESKEIFEGVKKKILSEKYDQPIIQLYGKDILLNDFCSSREVLYVNDLMTLQKRFSIYSLAGAKSTGTWKKISKSCPPGTTTINKKKESVILSNFEIVDTSEFVGIPAEYLEDVKVEDINNIVGTIAKKEAEDNLPSVLLWNYEEGKLLPPEVDLEKFCENPNICLPLKQMFNLYDIWKIKDEIDSARKGSANTLKNLLRRVADATTKHFHKTWKEYDDIKFSLAIDGNKIIPTIEDKSNHYELSQRSDGFKRFVTFLLLVSTEAENEILTDTLLLIDEPEIGLHPTGTRYLRDELIKISQQNQVVLSTHSIFMIDNQVIRRHLIVKKQHETTQVEEVTESNIQDEEVIYKSLGYSIFSNLKEKNLIFEGWRDKKLFEIAVTRVPATHNQIKDPLKAVGRCFSQGVRQIGNITPLFEAGDRKCLILSDNDTMAKEKQRDYKASKGYGAWKRYDEICNDCTAITGEDFIKESLFTAPMESLRGKHNLTSLPTTITDPRGKIYMIRQWLSTAGLTRDVIEESILEVKESVFTNLKNSDIEAGYYDYLSAVTTELERL